MTLCLPDSPFFQKILSGQLDSRLYRFGTTRHKVNTVEPGGGMADQQISQLFRGFTGKKRGMRKGQLIHLPGDPKHNFPVTMTEAGHRSASGTHPDMVCRCYQSDSSPALSLPPGCLFPEIAEIPCSYQTCSTIDCWQCCQGYQHGSLADFHQSAINIPGKSSGLSGQRPPYQGKPESAPDHRDYKPGPGNNAKNQTDCNPGKQDSARIKAPG